MPRSKGEPIGVIDNPRPQPTVNLNTRLGGNRCDHDGKATVKRAELTPGPLRSVRAKIARADEHLSTIRRLDGEFETVDCHVMFTEDRELNLGYFVIQMPEPPLELSAVVGDFLSNIRSALDYMVTQVVAANPPHKPNRQTMFPICSSRDNFQEQLKRRRLAGVPSNALTIIESVQPFDLLRHPLALLDELCNADKHRDLHFTTSVASDLAVSFSRGGHVYYHMVLGNDEVRNGAVLGGVGMDLTMAQPLPDVHIDSEAEAFIAFRDVLNSWEDPLPLSATLEEIRT